MLTEERRRRILEMLHQDGKVLASQLTEVFDVSEDTIRRDLNELAASGQIQRVHGGALPPTPAGGSYAARQHQQPQAKAEIAQAAMQLIRDHQVILLDGGTTPLQVAQRLPRTLQATVITHSPPIATALAEHPTVEVIVVGGSSTNILWQRLERVPWKPIVRYAQTSASLAFVACIQNWGSARTTLKKPR